MEYDNTEIGLYVKANDKAKSLTKIALPEFVEVLDKYSFSYCNSLKTLKLPKSLKILEKNAIPSKVETIEYDGTRAELASHLQSVSDDVEITCKDGVFKLTEDIDDITYKFVNGGYCVTAIGPSLTTADIKESIYDIPVTSIDIEDENKWYMLNRIIIPSKINNISE